MADVRGRDGSITGWMPGVAKTVTRVNFAMHVIFLHIHKAAAVAAAKAQAAPAPAPTVK
jgi:hypothetical protein